MGIAGKIKSNVRELEGSLIRLIAYASLTGSEISLTLAQEVLRDLLDSDDQNVTIEMVQKFVANYYKLKIVDLKSRNNAQTVTLPRQIAMYLVKIADDLLAPTDRQELWWEASLVDSGRFGIIPTERTVPPGSATATAIVSACTSRPTNRTFFMTSSFRRGLCGGRARTRSVLTHCESEPVVPS